MLFAIFGHDRNGALARRLEVRPQHLARIDQLVEENRILIAGPLPRPRMNPLPKKVSTAA